MQHMAFARLNLELFTGYHDAAQPSVQEACGVNEGIVSKTGQFNVKYRHSCQTAETTPLND